MFAEAILASTLQIGPFWQQWIGHKALCPIWSREQTAETAKYPAVDTTDVLWPLFTSHRDWWRFLFVMHCQTQKDGGYQFMLFPIWFNGNDPESGDYWGLFPLWGRHPHFLMMNDWRFCLWPIWMQYKTPRPSENRLMTSNVVLFPFFHWRDDGSWGVWPLCGTGHQRESDHHYALWPFFTWARYRKDRDTAGEGSSWMVWPLWADVSRERESQWMFIPPFFGHSKTPSGSRLRCPWPFFEKESTTAKERLSVFPFYEKVSLKDYRKGKSESGVTRFGWRLVEIYRNASGEVEETRVFPFWAKGRGFFRLWPFWATETLDAKNGVAYSRCLNLIPIRWIDAIDRNWSPYWTFYESVSRPTHTDHSLLWGLIKWRTEESL